jgi:alkaline phosphatase D
MPLPLSALHRGLAGLTQTGDELRLYGRQAWGRLAQLHLLDCRQYRSAPACTGLRGLVNPHNCAALAQPDRTLLGTEQEAWLLDGLADTERPWQLMLQTTMVAPRRIPFGGGHRVWIDGWDGHPASRQRLLERLQAQRTPGAVFLGGDLHENWATEIRQPDGKPLATEFVSTGITMKSFFPRMTPDILAANPHARYADGSACGYALIDVTPQRLRCDFRVIDSLASNTPAVRTAASFTVETGQPRVLTS